MDLPMSVTIDHAYARRIADHAADLDNQSPAAAALLRAMNALACGHPGIAKIRAVEAVYAIDGTVPSSKEMKRARADAADLVRSASGKYSVQACVMRSLGEAMSRLAKDGSLLRTSEIIGGLVPRLLEMERAQENIVIAA